MAVAIVLGSAIAAAWGDVLGTGVRDAAAHGKAQAAAEIRRARQSLINSTKEKLRQKITAADEAGPLGSALWWGLAAVRSGRKAARAMKGLRRGASGAAARILPSAGPLRRIRDAMAAGFMAGVRRARQAACDRRVSRRSFGERLRQGARNAASWVPFSRTGTPPLQLGVCDDCGAVVAATALVPSGPWMLCVQCRNPAQAPERDAESQPEPAEPVALTSPATASQPATVPALTNGVPVPGALARRTAAPSVESATGVPRDLSTHGDWDRLARDIADALQALGNCQEAMLSHLHAADAGRTQVADVRAWSDRVSGDMQFTRSMIATVNTRMNPLIDAVAAAGGPAEVASPAYHSDY